MDILRSQGDYVMDGDNQNHYYEGGDDDDQYDEEFFE